MSLGDRLRLEGKLVGVAEGKRVGRAEGRAEGEQLGIAKGERIGITKGRAEGKQVGIAKGKRVGRAEGEQVGIEKTAINMISSGMDDDLIEEITELSVDKIKRLRKTYNGGRG